MSTTKEYLILSVKWFSNDFQSTKKSIRLSKLLFFSDFLDKVW